MVSTSNDITLLLGDLIGNVLADFLHKYFNRSGAEMISSEIKKYI